MSLRYCFESSHVPATLSASKKSDLAVVDTEGQEEVVREAVKRGVWVYGYLNIGALEKQRPYYEKFKHLRLARYDGWDGEYWIDPTAREWQEHILSLAKEIKATGAIGLYLDNTDIYYMCQQGFKEEKTKMLRSAPSAQAVYAALANIILKISALGLIVMPNGGDVFLRKFMVAHPGVIATINQEGVFFEELNKKNKSSDTKYYKDYCKWAQKRISGKVRIIEYTSSKTEQAKIKAYCIAHGWDVYFSKHKDLRGDWMAYEISGTGTPSKTPYKWGLLKFGMKVTARLQPKVTASPCSFSPIDGLTKIEVCDQITDPDTGRVWDYCKVGDKYGFILYTSIRDYLRTPGQSIEKVARWVIANDFSTNETRRKALESLGYDYDAVQKVVTDLMPKPAPAKHSKFCVWAVNFMEDDEAQFGDCTAVIQYNADGTVKHCVLIDCAKYAAAYVVVRKLKAHGVKKIDAVCISHAHGDHYGGLSYIMKHIPVSHIYVPDVTELKRYQTGYASAIKSQAKKAPSTYLKAGTGFSIGDIKCKCVFICPASKLSEHDDHHFVNNESMVLRFDLDGIIYHTAGDLQNPANNVLIKAVSNLKADIYKAQWHGDANACNEAICKAVRPKYAFSNYHHKPSMSGRGTTRKRLQAVGAKFYDNYTYGDIFFNIDNGNISVKTGKR